MPLFHLFLVLLTIAIWGFNFVVIKWGLQGIPPLFLCFLRFFLTSIPAVFFIKRPNAPLKMILLYGWIMFAIQFGFVFFAIHAGLSVSLASILLQFQAFFSILLSMFFLGERPHLWTLLGGLVSFSGIYLVALNTRGEASWLGLALILISAFFWAIGSLIVKKLPGVNTFSLVIWGSFIAWPPLLLASYFLEGGAALFQNLQLTPLVLTSVLYIVYCATVFCFGSWNWLLQQHPVSKVAPFTLLVPMVAIWSSAFCLGEMIHPWKIGAGILVIGGLCIHLLGPKLKALYEKASL